jgi:serine protease Do
MLAIVNDSQAKLKNITYIMNNRTFSIMTFAGAGLLGVAALVLAEEAPHKLNLAEFESKMTRDVTEVRNPGQIVMSYADVVEKSLPGVVSITTYSKKGAGQHGAIPGMTPEDMEQIPPMFREFFKDWLEKNGGEDAPRSQRPRGPQKPQRNGLGSGVILTSDGYIMTNNHVVESADEIKVMIGGKSREYPAKVIGTDPSTDIALIKIEATDLVKATVGDSSKLRVGDVVLALGSPMGLEQSVTQGIISALGRSQMGIVSNKGQYGYENFIQTDAAINPGNSGGPLVDASGRVIGINTAIETRSGMFSGIGLAIPVNMALNVVGDLLDDGKVDRGFLGIQMDPVDPSMAEFLGLQDQDGVTVTRVVEGSPADKAGFEEGDVIVSADGVKVAEPSKLRLAVSSRHAGESLKFDVVRFDEKLKKPQTMQISATLEKLEADKLAASAGNPGKKSGSSKASSFLEGVRVENLNEELREEYKIEADVTGVIVTSVEEESSAAKVGLEEGDVITQVNRQSVSSVAEALSNRGEVADAVQLKIIRAGQTKFLVIKG